MAKITRRDFLATGVAATAGSVSARGSASAKGITNWVKLVLRESRRDMSKSFSVDKKSPANFTLTQAI